jgi:hypothetical protein
MGDDDEDFGTATGGALVRASAGTDAPKMKLSSSLARASRDEFVYVGSKGEVRAPWRYRAQRAIGLGGAVGLGVLGVVFSILIGMPWFALLYLGTLGYVGGLWWHSERLKRGASLLAADRLDEATKLLEPLTRAKTATRTVRALAWQNLGGVEVRRGNHTLALEHVRKCREMFGRRGGVGPWRWINRFTEILLLAQVGRVDEARAARDELAEAPDGEYFFILKMNADLMIAFVDRRPDELPDELFDWAKVALETTTAELALALLSWAYLERGDDDMGTHLLDAAWDRIDARLFDRAYPKVFAWMQTAQAARP